MPKRLWRQVAQVPRKLFTTPPPFGQVVPTTHKYVPGWLRDTPGFLALAPDAADEDVYDVFGGFQRYWPIEIDGWHNEATRDTSHPRPRVFRTEEEAATALHEVFDRDDDWQAIAARAEHLR